MSANQEVVKKPIFLSYFVVWSTTIAVFALGVFLAVQGLIEGIDRVIPILFLSLVYIVFSAVLELTWPFEDKWYKKYDSNEIARPLFVVSPPFLVILILVSITVPNEDKIMVVESGTEVTNWTLNNPFVHDVAVSNRVVHVSSSVDVPVNDAATAMVHNVAHIRLNSTPEILSGVWATQQERADPNLPPQFIREKIHAAIAFGVHQNAELLTAEQVAVDAAQHLRRNADGHFDYVRLQITAIDGI
jgi:hypothetical protein